MSAKNWREEVFGLIRPEIDAHTLGVSSVANLLSQCGYKVIIGDLNISRAIADIENGNNTKILLNWIICNNITRLGFSYRLDPGDAQRDFGKVFFTLKKYNQLKEKGGKIKQIYFAGLPESCNRIKSEYNNQIPVFNGDETQLETLSKLGIEFDSIPFQIIEGSKYDSARMDFARQLINDGRWNLIAPKVRFKYRNFGTRRDTIQERLLNNQDPSFPPLMRAHVGPYNPDYSEAKKEFNSWLKILSQTKFLDIVSIGTSQLSQSDFGSDWQDKPNGGGVPVNSEKDFLDIYEVSRPMLIRTYAGTKNIPTLAKLYERTINMAWHTLSFWWFNKIDGRGPYNVLENLEQHIETLKYIASTGKPFEPNIPHHFSFRGSDDTSYVLSAYIAAIVAKKIGIRCLILQVMLNTPKYTWGIQDLAKTRALLKLVKELEDRNFKVFLQPRAGLDYFSSDFVNAKIQLASVSAMMDDIEPDNIKSPDIIHVVSYSEASRLANPAIINESIQITTSALFEYRKHKNRGLIDDMRNNFEVNERMNELYFEVKTLVRLIEENVPDPYSPMGLYTIFRKGIMPVPYLWECRDEFSEAIKWRTELVNGAVKVVDEHGYIINPIDRVLHIFKK